MTLRDARPTAVSHTGPTTAWNLEDSFKNIYSGFVNGIRMPTDGIQHARLTGTTDFEGITGAKCMTNEKEWIEVTSKANKVLPGRRGQLVRPRGLTRLIGITRCSTQN